MFQLLLKKTFECYIDMYLHYFSRCTPIVSTKVQSSINYHQIYAHGKLSSSNLVVLLRNLHYFSSVITLKESNHQVI